MIHVPQAIPLTQVHVAFAVGARSDPQGQEGLASLALALLETGTQTLSRRAFESRLDALGAHLNLSVSADYALVSVEVLSDKLDRALDLLADLLLSPALDEAEFERVRRLQRQEIVAARDDDRAVGSRLFRQYLFRYPGYGRPSRGTLASLERVRHADVARFVQQDLRAAPARIAVASDLPPERFADLPVRLRLRTDLPLPPLRPATDERRSGLRVLVVDKPERTQCACFVGTLAPPAAHSDGIALQVANTALGGSFTARLVQEIREKRGLSYGVGSSLTVLKDAGYFQARFAPNRERVLEAIPLARQVIGEWVDQGVREDELAFVREYLTHQHHFRLETPGAELYHRLVGDLLGRPADYLDRYVERLLALDRAKVNGALGAHLAGRAWVVGLVATADEALVDEVRDRLQPDQLKVVPYTDELIT